MNETTKMIKTMEDIKESISKSSGGKMDINQITNREEKEALANIVAEKVRDGQTIGFGLPIFQRTHTSFKWKFTANQILN